MMNDRLRNVIEPHNKLNGKNRESKISLILASLPVAIVIIVFLFCLVVSGGSTSENDMGAVWWIFVVSIWIMTPVTIIMNILSVYYGVKGLREKHTKYAWVGITIVLIELIIAILIYGVTTLSNLSEEKALQQEITQLKEEIINYETYADLSEFGLGVYKLKNEGDKYLWDITKSEDTVIDYDGVKMVFESYFNRKDKLGFDNAWGNSNEGKNVQYDVYYHEDTYIIVTPLWDEPGSLYYWGFIYLCKDINEGADLFDIGILDPNIIDNLEVLPKRTYTRKDLIDLLGKDF